MAMGMRLAVTMLTFAALAFGNGKSACASQLGPYVGGSYGITDRDLEIGPFDAFMQFLYPQLQFTPTSQTSTLDNEGQGFTGLIGYRYSAHLAFEGMFVDSGKATYRTRAVGLLGEGETELNTKLEAEVDGIGAYALGIIPLSYRWEIYGRAGLQFSTGRLGGRVNGGDGGLILEFSRDSATDYVAGLGVAMTLMDIYGARLEYTRIFDAGSDSTIEADADMLSLGFIVAF